MSHCSANGCSAHGVHNGPLRARGHTGPATGPPPTLARFRPCCCCEGLRALTAGPPGRARRTQACKRKYFLFTQECEKKYLLEMTNFRRISGIYAENEPESNQNLSKPGKVQFLLKSALRALFHQVFIRMLILFDPNLTPFWHVSGSILTPFWPPFGGPF